MCVLSACSRYPTFASFYPRYIELHQNTLNRRCHFLGHVFAAALLTTFALTGQLWCLVAAPVAGYGCSWFGHVWFEGNKPASKDNPFWSFFSSFAMLRDMLLRRLPF
jgi:hypothetical protein